LNRVLSYEFVACRILEIKDKREVLLYVTIRNAAAAWYVTSILQLYLLLIIKNNTKRMAIF